MYGLIMLMIYNNAAHLILSSTASTFLTTMSEKRKSASPSVVQLKSPRKTIRNEEKLYIETPSKKVNEMVTCHIVRVTHTSVRTSCDNTDRIKESAKSGAKVYQHYYGPMGMYVLKALCESHLYSIQNKYIV
jgi:hypothetical protein